METTVKISKLGNHILRVVDTNEYGNYMYVVQIKRKFLWWYYWSIIKTYKYKKDNISSKTIQERHAISYLNKIIETNGKL